MNSLEKELGTENKIVNLEEKEITKEEEKTYNNIKTAMDSAEKSDTPYLVQNEEDLKVVGNPNKAIKKKVTIEMEYAVPVDMNVEGEIVGDYKIVKKTYKDIFISGKIMSAVMGSIATLLPYFYKPTEDGDMVDYSRIETQEIIKSLRFPEFNDTLYLLLESVLGISKDLAEKAIPRSLTNFLETILIEFPELVNESYAFF